MCALVDGHRRIAAGGRGRGTASPGGNDAVPVRTTACRRFRWGCRPMRERDGPDDGVRPRGTGSDLRGDVAAATGRSATTSDRAAGRETAPGPAAFGTYGAGRPGPLLGTGLARAPARRP